MILRAHARPPAAILLLALAVLVFGCSPGEAVLYPNGLDCRSVPVVRGLPISGDEPVSVGTELECLYTCPDGEVVPLGPAIVGASKQQLDASAWCSAPAVISAPPPPAAVAVALPVINVPLPVTGDATRLPLELNVASCDPVARYINFRLGLPAQDQSAARLQVELNGNPTECHVPPNNPSILSCNIPFSTLFPALVVVRLDGAVLTHFTYDGTLCTAFATQEPGGQNGNPGVPAPITATMKGFTPIVPTRTPQPPSTPQPTSTPVPTSTSAPPTAVEPPTQTSPPSTEPPPTLAPSATAHPTNTPRPSPTHRPTATPKPTQGQPTEPPATDPPPPPTEPAPTQPE